jgi:hypothetical protein
MEAAFGPSGGGVVAHLSLDRAWGVTMWAVAKPLLGQFM